MKIIKKEFLFQNEIVNIYKINDCEEYRDLLADKNFDGIKKLAYLKSHKKNVVALVGRERIARTVAGEATISIQDTNAETFPNVCAIGTSDVAHNENSTTLHTEVFRTLITSRSHSDNQFRTLSHYLPEDCDGNFREEAVFMEGDDAVADSGYLLSVVALSAAEGNKTSSDALIVERIFTLSI